MKKPEISAVLRKLRLIYLADWVHFYVERYRKQRDNDAFKKANPDVTLPPDYLIYESFQIDYTKYYTQSINTAKWVADYFAKHIDLKDKNINNNIRNSYYVYLC